MSDNPPQEPANPWGAGSSGGNPGEPPTPPTPPSPPSGFPQGPAGNPGAPSAPGAPTPPPGPGFPPGAAGAPAAAGAAGAGGFAPPPSQGFGANFAEKSQSDIALGLTIGGLVSYFIACCFGPLIIVPVGLCGAGAFLADKDLKGIAAGLRDPAKQQQSKIARIIGLVGAGLGILLFVLFVILLIVSA